MPCKSLRFHFVHQSRAKKSKNKILFRVPSSKIEGGCALVRSERTRDGK